MIQSSFAIVWDLNLYRILLSFFYTKFLIHEIREKYEINDKKKNLDTFSYV